MPCAAGEYSAAESTTCSTCAAGYRCPFRDTTTTYPCRAGTYSAAGATSCTPCEAGKACPNVDGTGITTCSSGEYSLLGSTTCTQCPAGFACPNTDGSGMRKCDQGEFSKAGSLYCTVCPPGKACPDIGGTKMINCTLGEYSPMGSSICMPCPAGWQCPTIEGTANQPCRPGSFSIGRQTNCSMCPEGYACPSTEHSRLVACAQGTYSLGNQTSCKACPAGYSCADPTSVPVACPAGTYSLSGQKQCTFCPPGHQCYVQAAPPVLCQQGYYSPGNWTNCTECAAGYICPAGSQGPSPEGSICPPGHYCPNTRLTRKCPKGTYSSTLGATSISTCLNCTEGYHCPYDGMPGTEFQQPCPSGYFCPTGTAVYTDHPCPSGTTSNKQMLTNGTMCMPCPAGRYCGAANSNGGYKCPEGYYCPEGTAGVCLVDNAGNCNYRHTQPCPAGTYGGHGGGLHSPWQCKHCPKGHYCPIGSIVPEACPKGTYNSFENMTSNGACISCDGGMACPHVGIIHPWVNCSAGHYCFRGTVYPDDHPCPAGTYNDLQGSMRAEDCLPCPAGKACGYGTGGNKLQDTSCAPGHYCPEGTPFKTKYPCPPGTWHNATNLESANDCLPCPRGKACVSGSAVPAGCKPGHFCPERTKNVTDYPCPAGTFYSGSDAVQIEDCKICPRGFYCPQGSTTPAPCMPGSYGPERLGLTMAGPSPSGWPSCKSCPEGYECPDFNTITPAACGKGKWSRLAEAQCTDCNVGYYCPLNATSEGTMLNNTCPKGLYCGMKTDHVPGKQLDACPKGAYCIVATPLPQPCPEGTYRNAKGGEKEQDCFDCPAGKYCVVDANNTIPQPTGPCPAGYYCPNKTGVATTYPCPAGKYRGEVGGISLQSCADCPPGYTCENPGTATPAVCPRGKFCPGQTITPMNCPEGTFGNSTGLRHGEECSSCSPGYYCETAGLTTPTGICNQGFVCRVGSNSSSPLGDPANDKDNSKCPKGGYCPTGSSIAQACPKGTYLNFTGAVNKSQCMACTPGMYCAVGMLGKPTGTCRAGYYCSGGAFTPTQYRTTPGHYSGVGAFQEEPCAPGTYQPENGASSCRTCPKGYFCNDTAMTSGRECPKGFYCGYGTITPQPCLEGSYNPSLNLFNQSQCISCDPGSYCQSKGLVAPTGLCHGGYYCTLSARVPNPIGGGTGDLCTAGHFCRNGTHTPWPCPPGTYNPVRGASNETSCLACPPGKYCNGTGLVKPSGDCDAGYFCALGASLPKPLDSSGGICPTGKYCPVGSERPLGCPEGTYRGTVGGATCQTCPAQYYCPVNTTTPVDCPTGRYCPAGTNTTQPKCPPATFNNRTGLANITQCLPCKPGMYCYEYGLSFPNGPCQAGYVCASGAATPMGSATVVPNRATHCPSGYYCPEGSGAGTPCPPGKYFPSQGAGSQADCFDCKLGHYCGTPGLAAPTGACAAGYYCNVGSSVAMPTNPTYGGLCPIAHYCPANSSQPIPCPAGTFSNQTGQAVCLPCPPGFFCEAGSDMYENQRCPAGYFCPEGTISPGTSFPCPAGTFGGAMMLKSKAECTPCPGGKYCDTQGQQTESGTCSPGYYCLGNSSSATPNVANGNYPRNGGVCPIGSYCPLGSSNPTPCDGGKYCATGGLTTFTGTCDAGYYCPPGSSSSQQNRCTRGHYCPAGTDVPDACPNGTYSGSEGNTLKANCHECTAGWFCNGTGLAGPSSKCTPGFYCPRGTEVPVHQCSEGHQCPLGSMTEDPCPAGTWQNLEGQGACKKAPAGFYAEGLANTNYSLCPKGYYCPEGTELRNDNPCPSGTYGTETGAKGSSNCTDCPAGFYCETPGMTNWTGLCAPGYYCISGAETRNPSDGISGNICPAGRYCPAGSYMPIACPAGKYALEIGNDGPEDCLDCPMGYYCSGAAQLTNTTCDAGFICTGGSNTPTPQNGTGGWKCPEGTYCPKGTVVVYNCKPGTYNPEMGQKQCKLCPPGAYCPGTVEELYQNRTLITGSRGDVNFTDCPAGYYCPGNTSIPIACPPGTFSPVTRLTSLSQCEPCTRGQYCATAGLAAPTGPCYGGYFCNRSATEPTPNGTYPANGLCPAGSYCPNGTLGAIACPPGTFNSIRGQDKSSDCVPCTAGSYCETSGLTAPTGLCTAGFYCLAGASQAADNATKCIPGHVCPAGSPSPVQCKAGTYQPSTGAQECITCPAGYYCQDGPSLPIPCPIYSYCPANSSTPTQCPAGTYNYNATKLGAAENCTHCPTGKYCTGGRITGDCAAGYYCLSRQTTSTPATWNNQTGGPCRPGSYCPSGTLLEVPCPFGTMNPNEGGMNVSACEPCHAGRLCPVGASDGVPCPPGQYCAYNAQPPAAKCPMRTYQPILGATNNSACLTCPAGYWCNQTGLASYLHYPCPLGHYCPAGVTAPEACPAGTYRGTTGATSSADCAPCPPGEYCATGSTAGKPCPPGTYCRPGSNFTTVCPPGYFCPEKTNAPLPCNGSFYCPTNVSVPIPCPVGFYCPPTSGSYFSVAPLPCPLGYANNITASDRSSAATGCSICPAGYYRESQTVATCLVCPAGYVCEEGCRSSMPQNRSAHNGFPCPAGAYCPEGSSVPNYCPAGYHNPLTHQNLSSVCVPCPVDSFSASAGSGFCSPCGSSAVAPDEASTTCKCNATTRVYQTQTGACLCQSMFEYYNEFGDLYDGDSLYECQPKTYETCVRGQMRDHSTGKCVSSESCDSCGCDTCEVDKENGICVCTNDFVDPCDDDCQAVSERVTIKDGTISCYDPVSGSVATKAVSDITGWSGNAQGVGADATMVTIVADSSGHTANYGTSSSLASIVGCPQTAAASSSALRSRRVQLQGDYYGEYNPVYLQSSTSSPTAAPTGYPSSSICIKAGETVSWDLTSNAQSNYPVYQTNSALNSNAAFDYSAFTALANSIAANHTVHFFAHEFTQAGTYVFGDFSNQNVTTIVTVMPSGQECASSTITTINMVSMSQNGVQANSNIYVEPDLLIVLAVVLTFVVMGAMVGVYTHAKNSIEEKSLSFIQEDGGTKSEFQKLYLKLREQRKFEEDELKKQSDNFSAQCDRMVAETQQLKALLGVKMSIGATIFLEAAERFVMKEAMAQKSYFDRQTSSNEKQLLELLQKLLGSISQETDKLEREKKEPFPNLTPATVEEMLRTNMSDIKTYASQSVDKVDRVFKMSEQEHQRRAKFKANKGIVGETLYHMLTQHQSREAKIENEYLDSLKLFGDLVQNRMDQFVHDEALYGNALRAALLANNEQAQMGAISGHRAKRAKLCKNLEKTVRDFLKRQEAPHAKLTDMREMIRASNKTAQQQALRNIEAERQEQEAGLFRGLEPELATMIRVFLKEMCGELRSIKIPGVGDVDLAGAQSGGATPGDRKDAPAAEEKDPADEKDAMEEVARRQAEAEAERKRAALEELKASGANREELEHAEKVLKQRGELLKGILSEYNNQMSQEDEANMSQEDRERLQANREELAAKQRAHRAEKAAMEQKIKDEEERALAEAKRKMEEEEERLEQERKLLQSKLKTGNKGEAMIRQHEVMLDGLNDILGDETEKRRQRIAALKASLQRKKNERLAAHRGRLNEEEANLLAEMRNADPKDRAALEKELEELRKRNEAALRQAKVAAEQEMEMRLAKDRAALEKLAADAKASEAAARAKAAAAASAEGRSAEMEAKLKDALAQIEELKRREQEGDQRMEEAQAGFLDEDEVAAENARIRAELEAAERAAQEAKAKLAGGGESPEFKAFEALRAELQAYLESASVARAELLKKLTEAKKKRLQHLKDAGATPAELKAQEAQMNTSIDELLGDFDKRVEMRRAMLRKLREELEALQSGMSDESTMTAEAAAAIGKQVEAARARLKELEDAAEARRDTNLDRASDENTYVKNEISLIEQDELAMLQRIESELAKLEEARKAIAGSQGAADADKLSSELKSGDAQQRYLEELKKNMNKEMLDEERRKVAEEVKARMDSLLAEEERKRKAAEEKFKASLEGLGAEEREAKLKAFMASADREREKVQAELTKKKAAMKEKLRAKMAAARAKNKEAAEKKLLEEEAKRQLLEAKRREEAARAAEEAAFKAKIEQDAALSQEEKERKIADYMTNAKIQRDKMAKQMDARKAQMKDRLKAKMAARRAARRKAEEKAAEELKARAETADAMRSKMQEIKSSAGEEGLDSEAASEKIKELGEMLLKSLEDMRRKNRENLKSIMEAEPARADEVVADMKARHADEILSLENALESATAAYGESSPEVLNAQSDIAAKKQLHEAERGQTGDLTRQSTEEAMEKELKHQLTDLTKFQDHVLEQTKLLGAAGAVLGTALKTVVQSELDVINAQLDMYRRLAMTRQESNQRFKGEMEALEARAKREEAEHRRAEEARRKEAEEEARRRIEEDASKTAEEKEAEMKNYLSNAQSQRRAAEQKMAAAKKEKRERLMARMSALRKKRADALKKDIETEQQQAKKDIDALEDHQEALIEKQERVIKAEREELVNSVMANYAKRLEDVNRKMMNEKGAASSKLERLKAMARKRKQKRLQKMKERQAMETEKAREELKKIKAKAEAEAKKKRVDLPGIDLLYKLNKFQDDARVGYRNLDEDFVPREYKAQLSENARLRDELKEQHATELAELEERLTVEMTQALDNASAEIERAQQSELIVKKEELKGLEGQERINAVNQIQADLDSSRERKLNRMREKFEADKRMQIAQLNSDHSTQIEGERKMQQEALDKIIDERIKAEEKKVLRKNLTERNRKAAKGIVTKVMHPRHSRELKDQRVEHFRELADEIAKTIDEQMARKDARKQEIMERMEMGEIDQLEGDQQIRDLDNSFDEDEIKAAAEDKLKLGHEQAVTDLRREHFEEIKMHFKFHYPDEDFSTTRWRLPFIDMNEVMRKMEMEKQKRQQKAEDDLKALDAKIAEMKAQKEAQLKEEMAKYDSDMKKWEAKLKQKMDTVVAKKMHAQEKEEEDFRKAVEEDDTLDQDERDRQIQEYMEQADRKKANLEKQIELNKQKLRDRLKAKIEAQRAERAKARQREIERDIENKRQEQLRRLQEEAMEKERREAELKQKAVERFVNMGLRAAFRRRGVEKTCKRMLAVVGIEVKTEEEKKAEERFRKEAQEAHEKVAAELQGKAAQERAESARKGELGAPFLSKLESMEKVMMSLLQHEGLAVPAGMGGKKKVYIDNEEGKFRCNGTKPVEIPEAKLNARQHIAFRFGKRVVEVLSRDLVLQKPSRPGKLDRDGKGSLLQRVVAAGKKSKGSLAKALPVNLCIAKSLPAKPPGFPAHANAFYNSFHYDPESRTIFIRAERTRAVGEFAMVILHAMAHVRSGTWADTDPQFCAEFYRSLQQLCSHLFFETAKKAAPESKVAAAEAGLDSFLESRIPGSSADPFFSKSHMHRRLRNYLTFLHSARLRTHLSILEERVSKAAQSKIRDRVGSARADELIPDAEVKELESHIAAVEGEGDELNRQLIEVIGKIKEVSEAYIDGLEKSRSSVSESDVQRLYDLQDKLSRLDQDKSTLMKRLAATEALTVDLRSKLLKKQRK